MSRRKKDRWEVVNARKMLRDGTQLSAYLYSPFGDSRGVWFWAVRWSDGYFDGGEARNEKAAKLKARRVYEAKR